MSIASFIKARLRSPLGRAVGRYHTRFPKIKYASFIPVHYARLKAYEPDLIFAHDLSALPLSAMVARETGARLVFDSHELESHRNPPLTPGQKRQVQAVERKYLPRCDRVTTVCQSIADVLSAEYGVDDIELLYNAPYLHDGTSHPRWERRSGTDLRWDAGAGEGDFLVLYVGLITMNRGIEFALRAIEQLPARVKLVALGPGNQAMKDELRAYADELGLANRFILLDPVNPHEVYTYIQGADCSLIPIMPVTLSYEVALPNKFFESGFAGLPIVSADLVEMRAMIEEYGLGQTYRALDEEDCADKLLAVYRDPAAHRPRARDTARFKARFAWENQAEVLVELAESLIGPPRESAPEPDSSHHAGNEIPVTRTAPPKTLPNTQLVPPHDTKTIP